MKIKKSNVIKIISATFKWEVKDRVIFKGGRGFYLGTIIAIKQANKKLRIELDIGKNKLVPFDSDKIVGIPIKKKNKKVIREAELKKWLDKKATKKMEKGRKVVSSEPKDKLKKVKVKVKPEKKGRKPKGKIDIIPKAKPVWKKGDRILHIGYDGTGETGTLSNKMKDGRWKVKIDQGYDRYYTDDDFVGRAIKKKSKKDIPKKDIHKWLDGDDAIAFKAKKKGEYDSLFEFIAKIKDLKAHLAKLDDKIERGHRSGARGKDSGPMERAMERLQPTYNEHTIVEHFLKFPKKKPTDDVISAWEEMLQSKGNKVKHKKQSAERAAKAATTKIKIGKKSYLPDDLVNKKVEWRSHSYKDPGEGVVVKVDLKRERVHCANGWKVPFSNLRKVVKTSKEEDALVKIMEDPKKLVGKTIVWYNKRSGSDEEGRVVSATKTKIKLDTGWRILPGSIVKLKNVKGAKDQTPVTAEDLVGKKVTWTSKGKKRRRGYRTFSVGGGQREAKVLEAKGKERVLCDNGYTVPIGMIQTVNGKPFERWK